MKLTAQGTVGVDLGKLEVDFEDYSETISKLIEQEVKNAVLDEIRGMLRSEFADFRDDVKRKVRKLLSEDRDAVYRVLDGVYKERLQREFSAIVGE